MELYIIRHGKTIWNSKNKLQGTTDIPLEKEGIFAAQKLGKELEEINFDKIFSSPLIRAYETAKFIAGNRKIEIIKDDRLKEISFGEFEGFTYKKMEEMGTPYKNFFTNPAEYLPPPKGETLENVCIRAKDFIQSEIEPFYSKYKRIMIVAHGAVNKGIMCYIQNHGIKDFWKDGLQQNCQALIFTFDGKTWKSNKH